MLDELLEDISLGGHNVVSTVYLEAGSFYTAGATEPLAPFGVVPIDPFMAKLVAGKCVCPEPQSCSA